jgi:hypothetical protein
VVVLDILTVADCVKGRVVGIPESVLDTVPDRVNDTDLERVTEMVGVPVGTLEGLIVVAAEGERVIETDRVLDTDTVPERVKGRVVGIPESVLDTVTERVNDTDLVRVTEMVGVPVGTLEGLIVVAAEGERVSDTDRVLDTDTVPEHVIKLEGLTVGNPESVLDTVPEGVAKLEGFTVGNPESVLDTVPERVNDTDLVRVTDTVPDRVSETETDFVLAFDDGIGERVTVVLLVLVNETETVGLVVKGRVVGIPVLVIEADTDLVLIFDVGTGEAEIDTV